MNNQKTKTRVDKLTLTFLKNLQVTGNNDMKKENKLKAKVILEQK